MGEGEIEEAMGRRGRSRGDGGDGGGKCKASEIGVRHATAPPLHSPPPACTLSLMSDSYHLDELSSRPIRSLDFSGSTNQSLVLSCQIYKRRRKYIFTGRLTRLCKH